MDRHTFPNGGWQFRQPQTNWTNPYALVSFNESVKAIIKHRNANPAVTAKHKLSTDFDAVSAELEEYTRKRLGLPSEGSRPFRSPPARLLPASVAQAVAGVKRVAAGAALLLDWEQSGESPVTPEVSSSRAALCVQCPKNTAGDFTAWFTKPVADMLRQKLARLHAMNLTTPDDAKLHVCDACACPLKLKVHTPLGMIENHMKPETKAALWDRCWILNEQAQRRGAAAAERPNTQQP